MMNTEGLKCLDCAAPVTGENAPFECGCNRPNCRCEKWQPGCWYWDDGEYTCGNCSSVFVASVCGDNGVEFVRKTPLKKG